MRTVRAPSRFTTQLGSPRDLKGLKILKICRRPRSGKEIPTPLSEAEQDAMEVAEKDAEIARLQKRCALVDSLLGECIRHHYYDDTEVSQTWLVEARKAITP